MLASLHRNRTYFPLVFFQPRDGSVAPSGVTHLWKHKNECNQKVSNMLFICLYCLIVDSIIQFIDAMSRYRDPLALKRAVEWISMNAAKDIPELFAPPMLEEDRAWLANPEVELRSALQALTVPRPEVVPQVHPGFRSARAVAISQGILAGPGVRPPSPPPAGGLPCPTTPPPRPQRAPTPFPKDSSPLEPGENCPPSDPFLPPPQRHQVSQGQNGNGVALTLNLHGPPPRQPFPSRSVKGA